ncbi:MAG: hypothetical protein HY763_13800 [Planctomycetes bacterium]|nr:hypothetical protein [Planctomycetota bacterium]
MYRGGVLGVVVAISTLAHSGTAVRATPVGGLGPFLPGERTQTHAGGYLIGGTSDGVLYDIDPLTGVASNPRSTGITDLVGLALSPSGVLYGRTGSTVSPFRTFYRIDISNGGSERLGLIPYGLDFEFDPTTSLLYSASPGAPGASHNLFTFDPAILTFQNIGEVDASFASIAVDPHGKVFAIGNGIGAVGDVVLYVDKTNGNTLRSWTLTLDFGFLGAAFARDGTLFISEGRPGGTGNLYRFDVGSGSLITIGSTGVTAGITSLTYVPEPAVAALLGSCAIVLITMRRRSRPRVAAMLALTLIAAGKPAYAAETGLGHEATLWYSATLHGGFVVSGASTRTVVADSIQQTDPIIVNVSGIPQDSTIEAAYASWSYLTNMPGATAETEIRINDVPVVGVQSGIADDDLCWDIPVPHYYTAAYTAAIPLAALRTGGNGAYLIAGALDEPGSDALAEGVSILIVYEHPSVPLNVVNVFSGLATTETGFLLGEARADVAFRDAALNTAPYIGGGLRFFTNSLDGQVNSEPRNWDDGGCAAADNALPKGVEKHDFSEFQHGQCR